MATLQYNLQGLQFEAPAGTSHAASSTDDTSVPSNINSADWHVFVILCEFLQSDDSISLQDAVDRSIEFYSDGYDQRRAINDVCFELADQTPYDHSAHSKLASFLMKVATSEKRISKSKYKNNPESAKQMFYQQLAEDLTDNRNGPDGRVDDGQDPMQYVNYQAFLATLKSHGFILGLLSDLEYAMRDAFEEDHSGESPEVRDAWVMGAAQWILRAGSELYKQFVTPGPTSEETGFSWKERQSWKMGFEKIVSDQHFGQTCRTMAEEVVKKMDSLEKTFGQGR